MIKLVERVKTEILNTEFFFVAVTRAKKRLYYMALDPVSRFNYVPGKDII